MDSERYVLRVEGARKRFGRTTVLKAATLCVEAGKVTTLMGLNGSGKTTLMRIAAGLLRPDQGVVAFRGRVVDRPRLPELARLGLMYLPQERLVVPRFTVRAHFEALTAAFDCAAREETIELCRLANLMDQKAESLSGGEKAQ